MFDWGAKAVSDILEGDVTFGLKNAMSRIYDRSWIFNGLPEFLSRIKVHTIRQVMQINLPLNCPLSPCSRRGLTHVPLYSWTTAVVILY